MVEAVVGGQNHHSYVHHHYHHVQNPIKAEPSDNSLSESSKAEPDDDKGNKLLIIARCWVIDA